VVAALLRLRFQVLANTLARNTIQVVAVVLGTLQALVVLALVVAGLAVLVIYPQPVQQATVVIGGVALTLGWLLIPLLATGIEPTVDPLKLSPFPIPVGRLMVAMTLVGATWVPGIVTFLASIATALAWRQTPVAAALALLCGAIATLICIVGSRMTASLTANLVSGRRIGQRLAALLIAALVLIAPVALAVVLGLRTSDPFPGTAAVLGATPFGAIWSVPGEVAGGHPRVAAIEFAIALVTLALMLVIWRWSLLATFGARGGGARGRQLGAGRLGVFRLVPATPAGAIAARSLISWARDARFARIRRGSSMWRPPRSPGCCRSHSSQSSPTTGRPTRCTSRRACAASTTAPVGPPGCCCSPCPPSCWWPWSRWPSPAPWRSSPPCSGSRSACCCPGSPSCRCPRRRS
jgi:ABC-2 type transport system permease protein